LAFNSHIINENGQNGQIKTGLNLGINIQNLNFKG